MKSSAKFYSIRVFVLLLLAILLMLPNFGRLFDLYDEGLIVTGAMRMANGEIIYRDFWTAYGPLSFLPLAILFKVFGVSVEVSRLLFFAVVAALAFATYRCVSAVGSSKLGILTALLTVIFIAAHDVFNYPPVLALCLSLWGLVCVYEGKARLGGVFVGLACLVRHDFAIYLIPAVALYYFCVGSLKIDMKSSIIGFLGVSLPVAGLLLVFVDWNVLWQIFIKFPLEIYPEVRAAASLATSGNIGDIIWHPQVTSIAFVLFSASFALLVLVQPALSPESKRIRASLVSLMLFTLLLLQLAAVRSDSAHMLPSALMAIVLLSFCASAALVMERAWVQLVAICSIVSVLVFSSPYAYAALRKQGDMWSKILNGEQFLAVRYRENARELITYFKENSSSSQPTFIGMSQHACSRGGHPGLYALLQATPISRYHELHPGVIDESAVQDEVIAEIERRPEASVVLMKNSGSCQQATTKLDLYLAEKFAVVKQLQRSMVLRRIAATGVAAHSGME